MQILYLSRVFYTKIHPLAQEQLLFGVFFVCLVVWLFGWWFFFGRVDNFSVKCLSFVIVSTR